MECPSCGNNNEPITSIGKFLESTLGFDWIPLKTIKSCESCKLEFPSWVEPIYKYRVGIGLYNTQYEPQLVHAKWFYETGREAFKQRGSGKNFGYANAIRILERMTFNKGYRWGRNPEAADYLTGIEKDNAELTARIIGDTNISETTEAPITTPPKQPKPKQTKPDFSWSEHFNNVWNSRIVAWIGFSVAAIGVVVVVGWAVIGISIVLWSVFLAFMPVFLFFIANSNWANNNIKSPKMIALFAIVLIILFMIWLANADTWIRNL